MLKTVLGISYTPVIIKLSSFYPCPSSSSSLAATAAANKGRTTEAIATTMKLKKDGVVKVVSTLLVF